MGAVKLYTQYQAVNILAIQFNFPDWKCQLHQLLVKPSNLRVRPYQGEFKSTMPVNYHMIIQAPPEERELFTTEHFSCKCATHPWPEHPLQIYLLFLVWHVMQNQSCLVLRRTPRGTNTEKALSQKPIKLKTKSRMNLNSRWTFDLLKCNDEVL